MLIYFNCYFYDWKLKIRLEVFFELLFYLVIIVIVDFIGVDVGELVNIY